MNTVSLRHDRASDTSGGDRLCVRFVDTCDSTNDSVFASEWSHMSPPWALATFDQRAGRGRQGRVWANRPGESLALTVVVEPRLSRDLWGWYSLAAALACRAVVGAGVHVKWPNDVVDSDFRKVAGILSQVRGERLAIGVGVNLRGDLDQGEPLVARASTVAFAAPDRAQGFETVGGRESFARELAQSVVSVCNELESGDAGVHTIQSRYDVNCVTVGRSVWVETTGGIPEPQLAVGVDRYGHLLAQEPDGIRRTLSAADVHLLPPPQTSTHHGDPQQGRKQE